MVTPTEYQKKIITEDKKKCGIFTSTGSGKTAIALHLANNTPNAKTLVICNKQQFLDRTFERNKELFQLDDLELTVISKEQFKKHWKEYAVRHWDAVIIDETHRVLSGIYPDIVFRNKKRVPKMSQLFEVVYNFLTFVNPERLYLLSATPAAKPMRVFAMATFLGEKWDFQAFRDKFYYERPLSNHRTVWDVRSNKELKDELAQMVKKFGYTGSLQDWYDVPEQIHKEEYLGLTYSQEQEIKKMKAEEFDPLIVAGQSRAIENGIRYTYTLKEVDGIETLERDTKLFKNYKTKRVLELAKEHPRMLVFARYTAQILSLQRVLMENGYKVYTLTGNTKNRESLIQEADKQDAIVIAQTSICEGYELKTYRTTVFASKSHAVEDYIQSLGRTLRMNALHSNLFIHLIVKGGADERCHKSIMEGKDFQEKLNM